MSTQMDRFLVSSAGFRSRIARHVAFPDDADPELSHSAKTMWGRQTYGLNAGTRQALADYIAAGCGHPRFANARLIRNALDHARQRQGNSLFPRRAQPGRCRYLSTILESDFRASRILRGGLDAGRVAGQAMAHRAAAGGAP